MQYTNFHLQQTLNKYCYVPGSKGEFMIESTSYVKNQLTDTPGSEDAQNEEQPHNQQNSSYNTPVSALEGEWRLSPINLYSLVPRPHPLARGHAHGRGTRLYNVSRQG